MSASEASFLQWDFHNAFIDKVKVKELLTILQHKSIFFLYSNVKLH